MLNGRDKVVEFIRFNNLKFWRLRRTEAGPFVFTQLDENFTLDDSIRKLTDALNYLDPGNYFIECGDSPSDKRGWNKSPFKIEGGVYNQGAAVAGGIGAITPDYVQQRIDEALTKDRQARELEDLKKRLAEAESKAKELEDEKKGFIYRFGNSIEPYVGGILEYFGIQPARQLAAARVSGIETENTNIDMSEKAENQQKRLEAAFERWSNYESDPALVIEKIVELAETNPKVYAKAKNLLLNPSALAFLG